jgi:hypothetical protein
MRFLVCLLAVFTFSVTSIASERIPWDAIHNHYKMNMPRGDKATVDLEQDGTLMLFPYSSNREYTHICWGKWKYEQDTQVLTIQKATMCEFLNGTYNVTRAKAGFMLKEGGKRLTLQYLNERN